MSTRKTLKDFFRSQGSVQNSISINPSDTSGNGSIESGDDIGADVESGQELLDLGDNTTGLLGDYVSFLMSAYDHQNGTFNGTIANFYRPGPKNTRAPNSNRGNRAHSALGADGNNIAFADENTRLGQTLSRYSNSGYISNLDSLVKKEGSPDNNNLISFMGSESSNTGETFINQQINEDAVEKTLDVFQGYNRYYPSKNPGDGSAYAEIGQSSSGNIDDNSVRVYNSLGDSETNLTEVRINNLFNLVPDLLQKYTGIKKSDLEGKRLNEIEEIFRNNENNKTLSSKDLRSNVQESLPDDVKSDGYQNKKGNILLDERNKRVEKGDYSDYSHEDPDSIIYLGSIRLMIVSSLMTAYFEEKNQSNDGDAGYLSRIRGASRTPGVIDTTYGYKDCIEEGLSVLFLNRDNALRSNKFEDVIKSTQIKESKYFWVAIFKSVIKESDRLLNLLEESSSKEFLKQFSNSRLVQFSNMIARIGDMSLFKTNGKGVSVEKEAPQKTSIIDEDKLPDSLSNIHSKNRSKAGETSWKQGSTPSLYMLPGNINRAAISLGSGLKGTNPIKSIIASGLSKETVITPAEGDLARIPTSLVEQLENDLEASYVPFYFHDLRTNEIISFHAFLNQLSDSFSPGYNPVSGYGRMDPVQIYRGTSRTINVGFTIAATSKKDFNEMWWKINKLITLLYPQWSKGTKVFDEITKSTFTQPFSQIIEASPMIRLRVGDVIKSNYSELAAARKFGIGNWDTFINQRPGISYGKATDAVLFYASVATRIANELINVGIQAALGSPVGLAQFGLDVLEFALRGSGDPTADKVATLRNTRSGKFGEKLWLNNLGIQSKKSEELSRKFKNPDIFDSKKDGPMPGDKIIIGSTLPDFPYWSEKDRKYYHIKSNLIAEIIEDEGRKVIDGITHYQAKIIDIDAPAMLSGKVILLRFEDFIISPEHMFLDFLVKKSKIMEFINEKGSIIDEDNAKQWREKGFTGEEIDPFRSILTDSIFMSPYASGLGTIASAFTGGETPTGNPVTRAFNSTKGRGLAGFINSFSIDLMPEDGSWELDYNSRAPKLVKITFGFAPVHDITPGIDHSGFNTAPIYNVGDIMKETSGDPWASKGSLGARSLKSQSFYLDK